MHTIASEEGNACVRSMTLTKLLTSGHASGKSSIFCVKCYGNKSIVWTKYYPQSVTWLKNVYIYDWNFKYIFISDMFFVALMISLVQN